MIEFRSATTRRFRECLLRLPPDVRSQAIKQYRLFRRDPYHPSLRFKPTSDHWSIRVNRDYRALAIREGNSLTWIWIGPHHEYDRILS